MITREQVNQHKQLGCKIVLFLAIPIAALMMVGCKRFEPHPLNAGRMAVELQKQNLQAPGVLKFLHENGLIPTPQTSPQEWNLERLTFAAYYYHPQLEVSRSEINLATAARVTARQRPNPRVVTTPTYNSTTTLPSPWILGGLIDYQIETAGKRKARMSAAQHQEIAARYNLAATAWRIRARVHRAYISLWEATVLEEATALQYSALATTHKLLNARYEAGDASHLELSRAQVDRKQARVNHLRRSNEKNTALVELAAAIGVSVESIHDLVFEFQELADIPPDLPPKAQVQVALTNRADLLASLANYAAAEEALKLEIARQYPNITLSPGYQYNQGDNRWQLGPTLELPFLHQNQGRIAEAEAFRENQAARVRLLQTAILAEIETALALYNNARETAAAATQGLVAAQNQERLARASYQAGEWSQLEVSNASSFLALSMITSRQAVASVHQALASLELAIQHPVLFPASPQEFN